jgi:hypothetical protein|nr:MAG TPA: hypothetical protein [Ackermannviridae sp.]
MKNSILRKHTQNYFGKTPQRVLDSDSTEWDYQSNSETGCRSKGESLVEQLQANFDNTPRDVLEKEELMRILKNSFYGMGPYVITDENEIREQNKEFISPLLKELNDFLNNASEEDLKRNWEDLKEWENVGPNAAEFVKELEKYV